MQTNIPLILYYGKTAPIVNFIKPYYYKAVIIDTDINQSGIMQGKILADTWNANKETLDNKSKYIPVVGIDGLPEAEELINQGAMTGTVVQDSPAHANAIYTVGMNLISGNNPLSGTDYKFDETGITIELPYSEYVK